MNSNTDTKILKSKIIQEVKELRIMMLNEKCIAIKYLEEGKLVYIKTFTIPLEKKNRREQMKNINRDFQIYLECIWKFGSTGQDDYYYSIMRKKLDK